MFRPNNNSKVQNPHWSWEPLGKLTKKMEPFIPLPSVNFCLQHLLHEHVVK